MSTIVLAMGHETYCMAGIKAGQAELIRNQRGQTQTPACVYLRSDGAHTVGYRNDWRSCDEERLIKGICDKEVLLSEEPIRVGDKSFCGRDIAAILVEQILSDAQREIGEIKTVAMMVPGTYGREVYVLAEEIKRWGKSIRLFCAEDVVAYSYVAQKNTTDRFSVCYMGYNALEMGTYERDWKKLKNTKIQVLKEDYVSAYREKIMSSILAQFFAYGYLPNVEQYSKAYRIADTESETVVAAPLNQDVCIPANFLLPFRIEGGIKFTGRELNALVREYGGFELDRQQVDFAEDMLLIRNGNYPVVYEELYNQLKAYGVNVVEWDYTNAVCALVEYLSEEFPEAEIEVCLPKDLLLTLDGGKKHMVFPAGTVVPAATEFAVLMRKKEKTRLVLSLRGDRILYADYQPQEDELVRVEVWLLPSGLVEATVNTTVGIIEFSGEITEQKMKEPCYLPEGTEIIRVADEDRNR